jgi:6-phosphogluconate dehydrogenase
MDNRSDVGLYGLAVMGRNLALNFLDHGYSVTVFNRNRQKGMDFLAAEGAAHPGLKLAADEAQFAASLKRPRTVILMVKAGDAVDETLDRLFPHLSEGDIIVDGGNSRWNDSARRDDDCAARGLRFVGLGVSGGEEGARHGPSFMPGGDAAAWPLLEPLLGAISAKGADGRPCVAWMGRGGAGHFVKTVHNAIEYADLELIAETYHLLRSSLRMSHDEMRTVFAEWNKTELSSYLIGITADALGVRDEDGEALVEKVLDSAGQKGTGCWAAEAALELGVPVALLADAVFARNLSALKDERVGASAVLGGPKAAATGERHSMVEDLRRALLAARVVAYAEGFLLLRAASAAYGWNLDLAKVALVWREGCIIRSSLLDPIAEAYRREGSLASLLLDSHFKSILDACLPSLRKVTARAIEQGLPVPAFASALAFFDGYRSTWLPANLIQALRDRFGAHGYERIDRPRGEAFHSEWR